jgi:hypothetical protein
MPNRTDKPFRFNVKLLHIDDVQNILSMANYPFTLQIIETLKTYAFLSDTFTLAVDIADTISNKLGIEFFFSNQQRGNAKSDSFLDKLLIEGLAKADVTEAIKNWPAIELIDPLSQKYPDNLLRLSRFLYPEAVGTFWTIINHFKIVFDNGSIEAKAYLAFGHSCNYLSKQ